MIGAVFFIVIITVGFNMLAYIFVQQNLLVNSLSARERSILDKKSEALQILDVKISSANTLNITGLNSGGRTIHIVRIWVTNQSGPPSHRAYAVNYWIDVAMILKGIGPGLGTFNAQSTYAYSLVTDRGNIFLARYAPSNKISVTSQGVGWLTMAWNLYNYTVSDGGVELGPYPAWCVTNVGGGNQRFQFLTQVINHWDRDVYLLSHSYLVFYQTSGSAQPFYLMDPNSTARNPIAYSAQITVPANQLDRTTGGTPTTLKFLADAPGGSSQSNNALNGGSFAVFVVLFYQDVSGATLSQTIPFEASEVT